MNIVAFQSWLSGYLDAVGGSPNAAQLARIRGKLETVEAADRTDSLITDMLKEQEKITAKHQATMADLAAMAEGRRLARAGLPGATVDERRASIGLGPVNG